MTAVETLPATAPGTATPRPRLRTWIVAALRDVAYAGAVLLWSVAGFSILVSGLSVTASLLLLVIGVLVWVAFVHVLRWATSVDRRLAGWQRREHVPAVHRRAATPGPIPYVRTLTTDPQTWRDLAWLALNSMAGFAYGLVVVTTAGLVLTYVSMPAWYWAVTHPHQEYGVTNLGVFTVDTLGEAALTMAIGLVLMPAVLLLARVGASLHAQLVVRLLGPSPASATGDEAARDA